MISEGNFTISVLDLQEAPGAITLSANTIEENQPIGTVVGQLSASDPDGEALIFTHQYLELEPPEDGSNPDPEGAQNFFEVDTNGTIRTTQSLNFEADPVSFDLTIWAEDPSGLISEGNFTISVLDLQEAPGAITLSANTIEENQPIGTVVGQLSASDPDGEAIFTHQYLELEPPEDGSNPDPEGAQNFFEVDTNGTIRTTQSLNFEADPVSFDLTIWAEDPSGLISEGNFTISVLDLQEAPGAITLSANTIEENQPIGTVVGQLSASDPDGEAAIFTHQYLELEPPEDGSNPDPEGAQNFFEVDTNGTIRTTQSLNFEADPVSFDLTIWAEDPSGLISEGNFTISVLDLQEAPGAITLSANTIEENQPIGTVVGQLSASDPDGEAIFTHQYLELEPPEDGSNPDPEGAQNFFEVDTNGTIRTTQSLNFEADPVSFDLTIWAEDPSGLISEGNFTISVLDLQEAPGAITLSANTIEENQPIGTVVGQLSASDPDGEALIFTHQYLELEPPEDGSNPDPEGAQNFFEVDTNGTIRTTQSLNFEADPVSFDLTIWAEDPSGLISEGNFTISVLDLQEAPGAITLSANTIEENQPIGTVVGQLSASDPDGEALIFTHQYLELEPPEDGSNPDPEGAQNFFEVDTNGTIRTTQSLNFEADPVSFDLTIWAEDPSGLISEGNFTISVLDLQEAPGAITLSANTIEENQPIGTVVGQLSASDPDGEALIFTHQYLELEPPEDGSNPDPEGAQNFFEVDTNGTIRTTQSLNFEADPVSFDLTIWAEDPSGLISEGNFTISVLDLQEAPGAITLSANTIEENQPIGTVVGQLSASDPDGSNPGSELIFTHQYLELEPPEDGSNPDPEGAQNFFEVDTNGTIRTTQSLNFEADPVSFDLTIWAEDPSGLISEGNFTISVLDQVEFHVMENQPADTLVGSVVNEGFGSKPTGSMSPSFLRNTTNSSTLIKRAILEPLSLSILKAIPNTSS